MNTFGRIYKVTNWGESHGKAIGVVIDGCPSLVALSEEDIQKELDRRAPGNNISTERDEADKVEILSGIFNGTTTGAPISLIIYNKDFRKEDYSEISEAFRPGHADYTYQQKYGTRDFYGGGRSSARITAGSVAAGAVAKKVIGDVEIIAYVKQIKDIKTGIDPMSVTANKVESSKVRCPDEKTAKKMLSLIEKVRKEGDSLGGIIECVIRNVPAGLGEPIFDKLSADFAKAMFSINAVKGFEIGSGFSSAELLGSKSNDEFMADKGRVMTKTNNSGGILGGISNGMPIIFRVAFKPAPSISKKQSTINLKGEKTVIEVSGRHDPCFLPRAVPIVEAMAAIVLCDHYLLDMATRGEKE